uniref:Ig-like domain-containing protein n=1 Tax=Oncorhynchus tshawytscha TaxID=74940 RepID=A0A8C8FFC4_ONCTS
LEHSLIYFCKTFSFVLFIVHALAGTEPSAIQQESGLMSANVGDTMVLQCLYKGDMAMHFSWYKQPFREKPHLISTIYKYDKYATFYHEFKDNPRFSVQSSNGVNHLSISDIKGSDSATYYCGSAHSNVVEFGKGTILNVKGISNSMSVLQQSVSESVQPGYSVTLNCTIHTETCAGGHSVYWFRHGSGESRPGIIYTHGDRSDQCEKSSEAGSPTQRCVYNLPKRNLSLSDDGTYYCAVASCGEILFGDGTKLDIHEMGNIKCLILSGGDIQVATEVDMRILVLLSIIRTGVLLCCLTIIFLIYLIRK